MKIITHSILIFVLCAVGLCAQDSVRIYGRATDFDSKVIAGVSVQLKDNTFADVARATTDSTGNYSMLVPKGRYYCIYAIRESDYAKTKLEYWAWNVPAHSDLEINPKYDAMEVYSVNAFEPQVGPWDTYMIYFRPMSLKKALAKHGNETKTEVIKGSVRASDTIDIAPTQITMKELNVWINGAIAEVISVQKITEFARGSYVYAYLLQVKKPKDATSGTNGYDRISVMLDSEETHEKGMSECFVEKIR